MPKYFYMNYTAYFVLIPDYIPYANTLENYYNLQFTYDNVAKTWKSDKIDTSLARNYKMSFKFKRNDNQNVYFILQSFVIIMLNSNCNLRISRGSVNIHYIHANQHYCNNF